MIKCITRMCAINKAGEKESKLQGFGVLSKQDTSNTNCRKQINNKARMTKNVTIIVNKEHNVTVRL